MCTRVTFHNRVASWWNRFNCCNWWIYRRMWDVVLTFVVILKVDGLCKRTHPVDNPHKQQVSHRSRSNEMISFILMTVIFLILLRAQRDKLNLTSFPLKWFNPFNHRSKFRPIRIANEPRALCTHNERWIVACLTALNLRGEKRTCLIEYNGISDNLARPDYITHKSESLKMLVIGQPRVCAMLAELGDSVLLFYLLRSWMIFNFCRNA